MARAPRVRTFGPLCTCGGKSKCCSALVRGCYVELRLKPSLSSDVFVQVGCVVAERVVCTGVVLVTFARKCFGLPCVVQDIGLREVYVRWSCARFRRRAQDWRVDRSGPKAVRDLTGVRRKHCGFWTGQPCRLYDGNRCPKLPRSCMRRRAEARQGRRAGGPLLSMSGARLLARAFGRWLGRS